MNSTPALSNARLITSRVASTRLTNSGLKLVDRYNAHTSLLSQLLLAPVEKAARGPALLRGDHE